MNGLTPEFQQEAQKRELHSTEIISCKSTVERVSFQPFLEFRPETQNFEPHQKPPSFTMKEKRSK